MNNKRWSWICTTAILCTYGFFKEFTPDEDFLTPYLDNETQYSKHFTIDQVNADIYPVWAYSYLVAVFFVLIFTDCLRYKPVVVLECAGQITTRILLIYGTSVLSMQLMQVSYGISTAAEIAYYSYIYVLVSQVHFQKVTSCIEASRLLGDAAAGFLSQAVVSTGLLNLLQLQYFSLASVCVASVIAAFLPNRCHATCRDDEDDTQAKTSMGTFSRSGDEADRAKRCCSTCGLRTVARRRWLDFKRFYSQPSLLKWSVWWALATCGYLQIDNYVQSLWSQIADGAGTKHQYNGLVEAVATLCASAGALSLSFVRVDWPVWGELTIAVVSLVDSAVLLVSSKTVYLWVAYSCYIVYRMTYSCLVTIAMAQIAYAMNYDSYGLVYGFNTFLGVLFQSLLTLAVSDERGLNLDIQTQFIVYSGYYYVLTIIFTFAGVYKLTVAGCLHSLRSCCHHSVQRVTETDVSSTPSESEPLLQ